MSILGLGFRLAAAGAATIAMLAAAAAAEPLRAPPGEAALAAARRFLCPHGGTPGPGGRCRPGSADIALPGWDRGLPAAAHRQAPCPPGTMAEAVATAAGVLRCRLHDVSRLPAQP